MRAAVCRRPDGQRGRPGTTRSAVARVATAGADEQSPSQHGNTGCACGGNCPRCARVPLRTVGGDDPARTPPSTQIATQDGSGSGSGSAGNGFGSGGSGSGPTPHAKLKSGPAYKPNGAQAPDPATHKLPFEIDAAFERDPSAGVAASCGEIRQQVKWDKAAADSFEAIHGKGHRTPHRGFPDDAKPDVWIEDRGRKGERFGHRADPFNKTNAYYADAHLYGQDKDGAYYHGFDDPGGSDQLAGHWTFRLGAVDTCNQDKALGGSDSLAIDWKAAPAAPKPKAK